MKRLPVITGLLVALCLAGYANSQLWRPGNILRQRWQAARPSARRAPQARQGSAGGQCDPNGGADADCCPAQAATLTGHHLAVCRVHTENKPIISHGSGVLIRYRGRFLILTGQHVIAERRSPIHVRFGTRARHHWCQAKLLGEDVTWDLAVLEIFEPGDVTPAELATGEAEAPREGAALEACGWGDTDNFRASRGRRTRPELGLPGVIGNDLLELTGTVREGDSGGPVFDAGGRVVGVIGSTDATGTQFTRARRIHALLASIVGTDSPKPGVSQQPAAEDPPPKIKPASTGLADLEARLARIEKHIAAFKPMPGPAGPRGMMGPIGPPGVAGTCDPSKLPPITFHTIKDGEVVHIEEVFLGGVVPFNLVPVGSKKNAHNSSSK